MAQNAMWAVMIFLCTYALIVSEKINRTIVAMLGGLLVVILGIVGQAAALHHIDFNTLGLLIGMMVIVSIMGQTGIFSYIAIAAAKKVACDPVRILVSLGLITAVFSALLDNVTTVLLMVPITFTITQKLKVAPEPYLVTQIICSNIGGTATLIGDPPNIMIGSAVKELTFMAFINNLAAVSVFILLVTVPILVAVYRRELQTTAALKQALLNMDERQQLKDIALLKKSATILALTLLGFFTHQIFHLESSVVALMGAFILLLLTSRNEHDVEQALRRVEWPTIFFFIGLFVLVAGLIETGIIGTLAQRTVELTGGDLTVTAMVILWLSGIASAFIDNIPFVATMIPMIQDMGQLGVTNLEPLWWSLALGACLGGNGTLVGASANLIVAGLAAQQDHPISFMRYFRIGFPLTLLSLLIASLYVYMRYLW